MEDDHSDDGDEKSKDAFPSDHLQRLDGVLLKNELLQHELRGSEDLRSGNHQYAQDGPQSLRLFLDISHHEHDRFNGPRPNLIVRLRLFVNRAGQTDEADSEHDDDERDPLVGEKPALEEQHAEQPHEQDQCSASHLVDTGRDEQQADVHKRGPRDVAARR